MPQPYPYTRNANDRWKCPVYGTVGDMTWVTHSSCPPGLTEISPCGLTGKHAIWTFPSQFVWLKRNHRGFDVPQTDRRTELTLGGHLVWLF